MNEIASDANEKTTYTEAMIESEKPSKMSSLSILFMKDSDNTDKEKCQNFR